MKQATFRGSGQLNGSRTINLTIEVEDKIALDLGGSNRNSVKLAILAIHYPGVIINPKDVGVEIKSIIASKPINKSEKIINKKQSFSLSNIIISLLFFPFKLAWRILKSIWRNNDHVGGTFLF